MPYANRARKGRTRAEREALYSHPATEFFAWLSLMMARRRLTEAHLAHDLHIDRMNVQAWREGSLPNGNSCIRLAEYFQTPLAQVYALAHIPIAADYQLGADDWRELPDVMTTPEEQVIAYILRQPFPAASQQRLIAAIQATESSIAATPRILEVLCNRCRLRYLRITHTEMHIQSGCASREESLP